MMDGGKLEMEMSWNTDTPSHISKYLINWILLVFSLSRVLEGTVCENCLLWGGRLPAPSTEIWL